MTSRTPLSPARAFAAILALATLGLWIFLGLSFFLTKGPFAAATAPWAKAILNLRLIALMLGAGLALLFALLLKRRGRQWLSEIPVSWRAIRFFFYSLFPPFALTSLARHYDLFAEDEYLLHSFFGSWLFLGFFLWGLAVLFARPRSSRGLVAALDIVCLNVLVIVCGVELLLNGYAQYSYSKLFWDQGSAASNVKKYRGTPGALYLGHPFNSQGFYSDEFFAPDKDDLTIAFVGDSFGLGVVPFPYNVATVTGRLLREKIGARYKRLAVHNFGICSLNMPDYAYLLERIVIPYRPNLVVLNIYVGNDIDFPDFGDERLVLQNWWVFKLPLRLWLAYGLPGVNAPKVGRAGEAEVGPTPQPELKPGEIPDWVHDPAKEIPHFPEKEFLALEAQKVKYCNPSLRVVRERFKAFAAVLERMRRMVGPNFMVQIAPDEYQVDDALWRRVLATKKNPENYDRDYPQKRILEMCREQGIPCLDLLPALREAHKNGRVHHLRDTHWNARGNRVAAEALSDFLLKPGAFPGLPGLGYAPGKQ